MFDLNFDLGEYAPDKMLAFGTSSVEEYTNNLKKQSIEMHRQLLTMFRKQLRGSDKILPENRPVIVNAVIDSVEGINLGFNTKKHTNRMKVVNLSNWASAKTQLNKIIDEMIEKVEA